MAEELNLGEAVRALQAEYGDTLKAGMDDGKEMMALTLQDRLSIPRDQADRVVSALIEARTIRWEGSVQAPAVQESGMFNVPAVRGEKGIWYF